MLYPSSPYPVRVSPIGLSLYVLNKTSWDIKSKTKHNQPLQYRWGQPRLDRVRVLTSTNSCDTKSQDHVIQITRRTEIKYRKLKPSCTLVSTVYPVCPSSSPSPTILVHQVVRPVIHLVVRLVVHQIVRLVVHLVVQITNTDNTPNSSTQLVHISNWTKHLCTPLRRSKDFLRFL